MGKKIQIKKGNGDGKQRQGKNENDRKVGKVERVGPRRQVQEWARERVREGKRMREKAGKFI